MLVALLTADEKARLAKLRVEASIMHTSIGQLLAEHKDNQLSTDGKLKCKTMLVTSIAIAGKN